MVPNKDQLKVYKRIKKIVEDEFGENTNFLILISPKEDENLIFTGDLCPVCSVEAATDWIEDKNVPHNHQKDVTSDGEVIN